MSKLKNKLLSIIKILNFLIKTMHKVVRRLAAKNNIIWLARLAPEQSANQWARVAGGLRLKAAR